MSDEFTKQATKEILEELEHNSKILISCQRDDDITSKCKEIEKHLHKIKGLAPMMDKKKVGELASINDKLLKKILQGKKITGIFETLIQSNKLMKELMQDSSIDIDVIMKTIKTKHSAVLD